MKYTNQSNSNDYNLSDLLAKAGDLDTDPEELVILSEHPNPDVQRAVGRNPNTPQRIITKFATSAHSRV